jgi:hypothetical protein
MCGSRRFAASNSLVARVPLPRGASRWLAALALLSVPLLPSALATPALLQASPTYVQVSAGPAHTLALRSDGGIDAWGSGTGGQYVPALPPGLTYVQVSAGGYLSVGYLYTTSIHGFSLARRSDGSVVAWGLDKFGLLAVPELPDGMTYIDIAAGAFNALALRSDGTLVAWGDNSTGACDVPALPAGSSYVQIAAGGYFFSRLLWGPFTWDLTYWYIGFGLALLSDGSVMAWGAVPGAVPALPPGVTNVGIAAGANHGWTLRSDGVIAKLGGGIWLPEPGHSFVDVQAGGSVVARVDDGTISHLDGPPVMVPVLPNGLTYDGLAAGGGYSEFTQIELQWDDEETIEYRLEHVGALRSDGTVIAWGDNKSGQCAAPANAGAQSYGWAKENSIGAGASIRAFGSNSLAENELVLEAILVPDEVFIFLHSPSKAELPFGNGTLLLGGMVERILPASLATGSSAKATVDLNSIGIDTPGPRNFQCWFRDTAAGGAGFNTSDALQITFVP